MDTKEKRLFLLDAYSIIYRSYFAFIRNPLINSKGLQTSTVFGFTNILLNILLKDKPSHLAAAFDLKHPTFRTQIFKEYKANRRETPDEIIVSIPYIKDILSAFNIPILSSKGFEADDVIGTISKKAQNQGFKTFIVSPDKDFCQLVSDNILIYKPASKKNSTNEIIDTQQVYEKYSVRDTLQIIDFLAMTGDASDNIPGIAGVGPKTAKKFIQDFGSIENLYKNLDKIKGKLKDKVEQNKENAFLSKKLVTIHTSVPIDFKEKNLSVKKPDLNKLIDIFQYLEFRKLVDVVNLEYNKSSATNINKQSSIFNPDEDKEMFSIKNTKHDYKTIYSNQELNELITKIKRQKYICFDTETSSLDTFEAELIGISISYKPHSGFYIPLNLPNINTKEALDSIKIIFEDEKINKIAHNIKFDMKILEKYNISVKGNTFDTMIAHYIIDANSRHKLSIISKNYLNYKCIDIEELIGEKGAKQKNMKDIPIDIVSDYAIEDVDICLQLYRILKQKLIDTNTLDLFQNIEMPLVDVLKSMEQTGVKVSQQKLNQIKQSISLDIADVEKKILSKAGEAFNISSPKQLGKILFEKLKIIPNPKKTKTGQFNTSEEAINKISHKHPIINDILEYRSLNKIKSTYILGLSDAINPLTKKVHTSFNQTITITGRLSSNNPNLQNIPIKSPKGKAIREAFIPTNQDSLILSADYSQMELRLIAEISKEENMTKAFLNDEDIHRSTASKVFNVNTVSPQQRNYAKTINFGIIYGVSAYGLSRQTSLSIKESKEIIDHYFNTYKNLKRWMQQHIHNARENQYVETLLNRRRYLKNINSSNSLQRAAEERNAINTTIQGSAADIIKIAMINIFLEFQKLKLKSKMLIQIHDEIVLKSIRTKLILQKK